MANEDIQTQTASNTEQVTFDFPINVNSNGIVTKVLKTQDTYVDRNIKITVNTPDAEFEQKDKGTGANGEVTAKVSTTDTTYTSDTETPYAITIAADAHVNPITVGTKTAGFTDASDETTIAASDADQVTKTIYVKAGALSGTGTAGASSDNIELTKVAEAPEDGSFFIKASGSGEVSIATAGWVDPANTTKVVTGGDAYYTVKTATLANTGNEAATKLDTPVLTEDGYLFINEGYIKDTKISLATLIPDNATLAGTNGKSPLMYKSVSAYDKDGKLIAGTMGDATLGAITANNAAATVKTVAVAANGDAFKVTGSGNISGSTSVAIATEGLAKTSLSKTGTISGTAKVDASLAKIGLAVSTSSDNGTVTPVIAKDAATTAKTGAIVTTQPTGIYVAVKTAENKKDVTLSAKVATAGYGTADAFNKTDSAITVGAETSGTYYVPITSGSHTITTNKSEVTAASATVSTSVKNKAGTSVSGILSVAPTAGDYLVIDGAATTTAGAVKTSSTCTVAEGYVSADTKTTVISENVAVKATAAAPKYIKIYDGSILDA